MIFNGQKVLSLKLIGQLYHALMNLFFIDAGNENNSIIDRTKDQQPQSYSAVRHQNFLNRGRSRPSRTLKQ